MGNAACEYPSREERRERCRASDPRGEREGAGRQIVPGVEREVAVTAQALPSKSSRRVEGKGGTRPGTHTSDSKVIIHKTKSKVLDNCYSVVISPRQ